MTSKEGVRDTRDSVFQIIPPFATQVETRTMFEKPQNLQKNFRLSNLHNKGYEPVSQSSLSLYTSKSNGHYGRRQHFQFGKTACGSATNALIYGSGHPLGELDVSGIKSKVQANKKPEKIENTNINMFIYGKNDHTNAQPRRRNSNIFSHGEKTSAELRKKIREVKERENQKFCLQQVSKQNDYNEYLQQKELQARIRDEEKRKDLDMLRTYKQPWGKPGGGAPTSDTHRSKEIHHLIDHKEQVLPLGKPGGGAPLRSDSGSLKAAIGLDPEIQFQKRHRDQVHNVIMPSNKTKRNDEYLTELDILAQKTREQRNVIVRDKDLSSTIYDPFGRPGAGAPLYDNNGKTKAARSKKLLKDVQGDTSKHQLKDTSLPYGTPRFKRPIEDTNEFQGFAAGFGKGGAGAPIVDKDGNVITTKRQTLVRSDDSAIIKCDEEPIDNASYNPWGRHGAGAPIRDQQGNLVTQVGGRWKSDQIAASPKQRQQVEAKKLYLESLRSQAREHEEWKQIERDSLKQPSNDTTSWLKRGVVGKPPYDENTREIVGAHRVTSDIVKQHEQPTDGIWGNFGTDAPKGNPRRQKAEFISSEAKDDIISNNITSPTESSFKSGPTVAQAKTRNTNENLNTFAVNDGLGHTTRQQPRKDSFIDDPTIGRTFKQNASEGLNTFAKNDGLGQTIQERPRIDSLLMDGPTALRVINPDTSKNLNTFAVNDGFGQTTRQRPRIDSLLMDGPTVGKMIDRNINENSNTFVTNDGLGQTTRQRPRIDSLLMDGPTVGKMIDRNINENSNSFVRNDGLGQLTRQRPRIDLLLIDGPTVGRIIDRNINENSNTFALNDGLDQTTRQRPRVDSLLMDGPTVGRMIDKNTNENSNTFTEKNKEEPTTRQQPYMNSILTSHEDPVDIIPTLHDDAYAFESKKPRLEAPFGTDYNRNAGRRHAIVLSDSLKRKLMSLQRNF